MKRTWIMGLAAGALIFGLGQAQPAEAYDEDKIAVSVLGLGNESADVVMDFQGMDEGDRYILQEKGSYSGAVTNYFPYKEGTLRFSKEDYPFLKNLEKGDKLEVQVVPSSDSSQEESRVWSKVFDVEEAYSFIPESMKITDTVLTRGAEDKDVRIEFNSGYVPGFFNEVIFTPLDKEGKDLKGVKTQKVEAGNLGDIKDMKVRLDIPKDAYSYRVEFRDAGSVIDSLTQTLDVGDYFGKLEGITLEANKEVQPGQEVTVKVIAIDSEGNRQDVTKLAKIVYPTKNVTEVQDKSGVFKVKDGHSIGSSFSVYVTFAGKADVMTFKVGEVVKSAKLQATIGTVGQEAKLTFQLVDADGKSVPLSWEPAEATVSFRNVSISGAGFTGKVTDFAKVDENGSGTLTLDAKGAASGEVLITFKNKDESLQISAGTFTFSAPKKEPINVIMGIGSSQLIINGKEAGRMDTYPIILQDRTFIPLRAMAEAFGATVDFNYDRNKEIRITLGDDEVVMHVGSKNYTRNGSAAVMDVAPYINSDNRTMVPVRFAAEALGFKVDANTHADGTTANVVISNDLS